MRDSLKGTDWGFTLIELMIVIAVLSILAAFAIPSLLSSKMTANEANVVGSMRSLMNAQELYKTRTGYYGDCVDLNDSHLGGLNIYIDSALAKADPDHPNHVNKAGYDIDISLGAGDWCCIATPANWQKDGARNFKLTSNGVIYYNTTENDKTNFTSVVGGS